MDLQMKRSPFRPNSRGAKPHPHRASAGPACCSAGAPGPAMQRGGGSKLKGLLRVPLRLPSSSAPAPLRMRQGARRARLTPAWRCGLVAQSPRPAAHHAIPAPSLLCGFASAMTGRRR